MAPSKTVWVPIGGVVKVGNNMQIIDVAQVVRVPNQENVALIKGRGGFDHDESRSRFFEEKERSINGSLLFV